MFDSKLLRRFYTAWTQSRSSRRPLSGQTFQAPAQAGLVERILLVQVDLRAASG